MTYERRVTTRTDEDPAVCSTEGCMNGVAGPGLHCDACLDADVESEVPW